MQRLEREARLDDDAPDIVLMRMVEEDEQRRKAEHNRKRSRQMLTIEVDEDVVGSFCKGPLFHFREVILALAEDLIPEGACYGQVELVALRKISRPEHVVGGRLVYRKT